MYGSGQKGTKRRRLRNLVVHAWVPQSIPEPQNLNERKIGKRKREKERKKLSFLLSFFLSFFLLIFLFFASLVYFLALVPTMVGLGSEPFVKK